MNQVSNTDVATADREMEEKANRAKEMLSRRYRGITNEQEAKHERKMKMERQMIHFPEEQKKTLRQHLAHEETQILKESRRKHSPADFESLAIIGRGAFGEVRLVREGKISGNSEGRNIYALKIMQKKMMVVKNQVNHVKAERDVLAEAAHDNRWLTVLHSSFQDDAHLYMVMEYMPGGDLMSLLIKDHVFSEDATRFFMAEAASAISSVHALGYIHRDIKPDNMLLDARGHLRLTDLGLCKKVGELSLTDHPEFVLETLRDGDWDTNYNFPSATPSNMRIDQQHQNTDFELPDHFQHDMSIEGTGPPLTRREMANSTVGTPDYIAPEVLASQNGSSGFSYTCAVDWWSLGVIMYECLVGYTPFYAEDPVKTCRKILRWRQCLEIPEETKSQLSHECIDFLSRLLSGPESRIGSQIDGSTEFKNGFKEVVPHPWFRNFDWDGFTERDGPLLPPGSSEFPRLLECLKTCPKSDPQFGKLVRRVTQNFDSFEDHGCNLDNQTGQKAVRVNKNSLDQFYDYHFQRKRKPKLPTLGAVFKE